MYQVNRGHGEGWVDITQDTMRAEFACSDSYFAKVLACLQAGGLAYGNGFYRQVIS